MSLDRLRTLASTPRTAWNRATADEFTELIRRALTGYRTLLFEVPCADRQDAIAWGGVAQDLVSINKDVIHTGGAHWDGETIRWNFSGWPIPSRRNVLGTHSAPKPVIQTSDAPAMSPKSMRDIVEARRSKP